MADAQVAAVHVEASIRDFAAAQGAYNRALQWNRYFLTATVPSIFSFIAVVFILPFVLNNTMQIPHEVGFLIALFLGFYLFILLQNLFARYRLNAYLAPGGSFLAPTDFELSSDGLHWRCRGGEGHWAWNAILNITETKTHIFLFVDKAAAHVIPKRCFPSESAMTEFVSAARGFFDKTHTAIP